MHRQKAIRSNNFCVLVFYSTPRSLANWLTAGRASHPCVYGTTDLGSHSRLSHLPLVSVVDLELMRVGSLKIRKTHN